MSLQEGGDLAPSKHRGLKPPWKPGQSGNPAGRKRGARNKLGEAFLEALHEDFESHGPDVIAKVRSEKPDQYLKVIASVLPKQFDVRVSEYDELSDDELERAIIRLVESRRKDQAGPVIEGRADEGGAQSIGALPPVSEAEAISRGGE